MPVRELMDDINKFVDSKVTTAEECFKLEQELISALQDRVIVSKIETKAKSDGKRLDARIAEVRFLLREYSRPAWSPQKSHFISVGRA